MAKRRIACLLLCLLLVLCTACGAQPDSDGALHCTVTIECATVLAHMDDLSPGKTELIPADGVLLPETAVAFSEGDTVFDVLQRVCRERKIPMEFSFTPIYNSAYIEGIYNLYEFDVGDGSGWMYKVNGVIVDQYMNAQTVSNRDNIVVFFTKDYTEETGYGHSGGSWNGSADADKKAAASVDDLISAIGGVKLNSEKDIAAARAAYDKLTAAQKKLVSNYDILTAAEQALADL